MCSIKVENMLESANKGPKKNENVRIYYFVDVIVFILIDVEIIFNSI